MVHHGFLRYTDVCTVDLSNGGFNRMPTNPQDILRVAATMNQLAIGDFVNVFHYRYDSVGTLSDTATGEDMSHLMDEMYAELTSSMPDGLNFIDVNVFNVTQSRPYGGFVWPTLTTGGQAAEELPAQIAGFVRGLSGFSRNWARKFVGPFCENLNIAGGTIAPGLVTALTNWAVDWMSADPLTIVGAYTPVVRYAAGGIWAPITSIVVSNIWATLRRRRIGRGS